MAKTGKVISKKPPPKKRTGHRHRDKVCAICGAQPKQHWLRHFKHQHDGTEPREMPTGGEITEPGFVAKVNRWAPKSGAPATTDVSTAAGDGAPARDGSGAPARDDGVRPRIWCITDDGWLQATKNSLGAATTFFAVNKADEPAADI